MTNFVMGAILGQKVKWLNLKTFNSENSLDTLFYRLIVFLQKVLTV